MTGKPLRLRATKPSRDDIETTIEALIDMLDASDTDPDLEDGADLEPVCEDEGAYDGDCGDDEDDPCSQGHELDPVAYEVHWQATRKACKRAAESLKAVQRRKALSPVLPS